MFRFLDPGAMIDNDLTLVLHRACQADRRRGLVPAYEFHMVHAESGQTMGRISLRIGQTEFIRLYAGHIGYGVDLAFRGRRYAARSCRLLLPLAARHGFQELWITVNPDNIPSRRTCEILGAEMVEIVDVPRGCDMYNHGDRQKCRYRLPVPRG
jgi:tagatose 1,6-diphosphate aldolase